LWQRRKAVNSLTNGLNPGIVDAHRDNTGSNLDSERYFQGCDNFQGVLQVYQCLKLIIHWNQHQVWMTLHEGLNGVLKSGVNIYYNVLELSRQSFLFPHRLWLLLFSLIKWLPNHCQVIIHNLPQSFGWFRSAIELRRTCVAVAINQQGSTQFLSKNAGHVDSQF